jgi:hypothetical protein
LGKKMKISAKAEYLSSTSHDSLVSVSNSSTNSMRPDKDCGDQLQVATEKIAVVLEDLRQKCQSSASMVNMFHGSLQELTFDYAKAIGSSIRSVGPSAGSTGAWLRGSAISAGAATGAISAEAAMGWKVGWDPALADAADRPDLYMAGSGKDKLEPRGHCPTAGLWPERAE